MLSVWNWFFWEKNKVIIIREDILKAESAHWDNEWKQSKELLNGKVREKTKIDFNILCKSQITHFHYKNSELNFYFSG